MLLNSIAAVCTGVGNRTNGNSMFIFVASWPGKRNVYEIYKFKGLYVKHGPWDSWKIAGGAIVDLLQ